MHNEVVGIPTRSADGRAALDIFYIDFNDVNFYVEDEDQENLYEVILGKLFPELDICRVFPLCGKKNVLIHASDPANVNSIVKSIYIVDKDFDDFLNRKVNDERIFYLEQYCIENYLVDPSAIINVVIETHPKKKPVEINTSLMLDEVILDTLNSLRPLFHLFYCVQSFDLGLKNCKSKAEEFCDSKSLWKISEDRLMNYTAKVIKEAAKRNIVPPLNDPLNDERSALAREAEAHSLVSGKFLLTMLFHYVKAKYSLGAITFESFTFRVAKNSELSSLKPFSDKIRALLDRSAITNETHIRNIDTSQNLSEFWPR